MSQSIERAAAILSALEPAPDGRSVSEIADEVGLARSTVHRTLKALESVQFVAVVSAQGGFRLGPALMRLAVSSSSWLVAMVHPRLEELSSKIDETVDLAVLAGRYVRFIDQVQASHRLQAVSQVGLDFPLSCTANGKAILAELDDEVVGRLVGRRLQPLTAASHTEIAALLEELESVRSRGFAFDHEEHHEGICALGTVIRNPYGLSLAVSVPIPAPRFAARRDDVAARLLETRARIEEELGSRG